MYKQFHIDEIISIEELEDTETIDISVSGNNLFVANNILTHNSAFDSSDIDMTNTSESIGLAATVDAMFALITSEELESMGQIMIKQLKNRWGDLSYYRRFVIGIDRSKMKLYNLEDGAQKNVQSEASADKPAFDKSSFGESFSKRGKKKFELEDIQ